MREGLSRHRYLHQILILKVEVIGVGVISVGAEGFWSVRRAEGHFLFFRNDPLHSEQFLLQFGYAGLPFILSL